MSRKTSDYCQILICCKNVDVLCENGGFDDFNKQISLGEQKLASASGPSRDSGVGSSQVSASRSDPSTQGASAAAVRGEPDGGIEYKVQLTDVKVNKFEDTLAILTQQLESFR